MCQMAIKDVITKAVAKAALGAEKALGTTFIYTHRNNGQPITLFGTAGGFTEKGRPATILGAETIENVRLFWASRQPGFPPDDDGGLEGDTIEYQEIVYTIVQTRNFDGNSDRWELKTEWAYVKSVQI